MGTLTERIRVKLHTDLSGLYKAWYDLRDAELTITYGPAKAVLDETECDRLLRMWEHSNDPISDLAEFFDDLPEFRRRGGRIALGFAQHVCELAECVYADEN